LIKYLPNELLNKIAPPKKIEKLVGGNLTLRKASLSFVDQIDFLSKDSIQRVALNVVDQYQTRFENEKDSGASASEAKETALNEKKLLVNRVQNEVVTQVANEIKDQYEGEYYIWLPSDALEPDPLHQLNYGKKFQLGKGEMPGDRYGCRCGMQILVSDDTLQL
jgi:hypothetical protein